SSFDGSSASLPVSKFTRSGFLPSFETTRDANAFELTSPTQLPNSTAAKLDCGHKSLLGHVLNVRRIVAGRWSTVQTQLAETAEIDRIAQNPRRLLRRMEAHRIFRHHKINHELSPALVVARRGQLRVGCAFRLLRFDVVDQVHQRVERVIAQIEERVL